MVGATGEGAEQPPQGGGGGGGCGGGGGGRPTSPKDLATAAAMTGVMPSRSNLAAKDLSLIHISEPTRRS
eukprot:1472626-Prymnesium_polylepis.1